MKNLYFKKFDFADSEFVALEYLTEDKQLVLTVKSWDAKLYNFIFDNCIEFDYKQSFQISNLFQNANIEEFLNNPQHNFHNSTLSKQDLKVFQLVDIDNFPFVTIFAESGRCISHDQQEKKLQ